jgi:hypothetical protein
LITLTILGEEYKPCSSSLCSFLQTPVTSSLLGPNTLLSTLFPNTLTLCSSLNVRVQVSHSYKTTGKIIVLYILIFAFNLKPGKTLNEVTVEVVKTFYNSDEVSRIMPGKKRLHIK